MPKNIALIEFQLVFVQLHHTSTAPRPPRRQLRMQIKDIPRRLTHAYDSAVRRLQQSQAPSWSVEGPVGW